MACVSQTANSKGTVLIRLPSLEKPTMSWGDPAHVHSDQLSKKLGFSTATLRFSNSLDLLTELRKVLYLLLKFFLRIIKEYKLKSTKGREEKGRVWNVLTWSF